MNGYTDMVKISEALEHIENRKFSIKEIFSEMNFERSKVYLYKNQTEIFIIMEMEQKRIINYQNII